MALIASLAVGGSYVLYGSQNKEELSDLALSNVEALTLGTKDCMYQRNSRCYELVVGPPGEPVIIETSEEANVLSRLKSIKIMIKIKLYYSIVTILFFLISCVSNKGNDFFIYSRQTDLWLLL